MAVGSIQRRLFDAALTTATLGISGNFTSSWFSAQDGGETFVEVVARADVASATNGFVIEESSSTADANFTRTVASFSLLAATTTYLRVQIRAGNWRVNYTNGGTGQASFRIAYAVSPQPIDQFIDYDTGTGIIPQEVVGIALPGAGGPVAGGTNTNPLQVGDAGGTLTIDNAALSVTGGGVEATALRVTIANDSTGLLSVDDNAGSLTVDNATISVVGGGAEATAQRVTIANDSTGVLSVDDNGGNLSIDWAGTVPPIGAGTEAAALRVTLATDSTGLISVDDNGGALTVDQATATSLKAEIVGPTADNAANPTAKVSVLPGVALAAAPTRTEGNVNPLRLNLAGDVAITLDAEAVVLGAGSANVGDVDVLTVPAPLSTTGGGTEATALRVTLANDSTGLVSVDDNSSSLTVDQATASNLKTEPAGQVAHGAADSGNPLKIGAKVETSPKGITVPVDGDRTDLYADSDGMLMVKINTSGADLLSERVSDTAGTSTAFTNFSAVASTFNYVTGITVFRTDAGTTPAYVDFRDGTAGAVKWSMPLPPNGGSVLPASGTPYFKTTANTALAYDVSAALTTVFISVSGFQSKV